MMVRQRMPESGLNCGLAFERSRESWGTQAGRTEVVEPGSRCAEGGNNIICSNSVFISLVTGRGKRQTGPRSWGS